MDKKILLLGIFLFLPGILMLLTLFSADFNSLDSNWYSTYTARVIFTVFCNSIAVVSLLLFIFKKNIPFDRLYDIITEKRKNSGTKAIMKFLNENNINTYSEEYVRKFVDENYDEIVKNLK